VSTFHRDVPAWPALGVLWVVLAVFVSQLASSVALAGVLAAAGADEVSAGALVAQSVAVAVAVIVAVVVVAARTAPPSPRQFGLRVGVPGRMVVGGLAAAVGLIALVAVWSLVVDLEDGLQVPTGLDPRSEFARDLDVPVRQGAIPVDGAFVVAVLGRCVLGALVTEVVVRGYVFPALAAWRGPVPAIGIVAVVFGALGGQSLAFAVPAAALAAGLCVLYLWSGSLLPTITVYAGASGAALAAASNLSASAIVLTACLCAAAALLLALLLVAATPRR
jgi:membrane protease YdiL (CAAX protease family)